VVAWQTDKRGEFDIDGKFVSRDGKLLTKNSLSVSSAQGDQYFAAVAWGKRQGLLVWEDHRDKDPGIYAARITNDRKILDPEGIPLVTGPELRQYPRIAWDGTQYLVIWEEERAAPLNVDILGVRVSEEGSILDPHPIPIGSHARDQFWSSVATNGATFLVVWTDQRSGEYDIYGARVDHSGHVLDREGIPISTESKEQEYPHVDWDGNRFWVVWVDKRNGSAVIYGTKVLSDGKVLDPEGIVLSRKSGVRAFPFILPLSSNQSLIMWEEETPTGRDILGSMVDDTGSVKQMNGIPIAVHPGIKHPLRAAKYQDQIFVVWQEKQPDETHIYGKLLREKDFKSK
jgi:hypothetical protein